MTRFNRRSFLKVSAAAGGGLVLGFSWSGCTQAADVRTLPESWVDVNAFLRIGDNGMVTIMSPNPEIGQNIKTAMPMIVAEELDVLWEDVIVEQAPLNTELYERQVAGGSQSIRHGWTSLRTAGATARHLLIAAAAERWGVEPSALTTRDGKVVRAETGEELGYGELAAAAAALPVPAEVPLKDPKDFKIIGTPRGNVDMDPILTGKPLFGIDTRREGMLYAAGLRPPAFGQTLVSFDASAAEAVPGVRQVVQYGDKVAVLATNTWAAIQGRNALTAEWKDPETLESTEAYDAALTRLLDTPSEEPQRADGNAKQALADADQVIERTYEAPFLPHNCLEPMNFFAHVQADKVELYGPIQTPERTQQRVADLLERPKEQIAIGMSRMGGGFGRRLYGDFVLEAAEISAKAGNVPVQLIYTREDDMTAGIYRPAVKYKFRAGIKDGKMVAFHLTGAGMGGGNFTRQDNFPAGCVEHYLVESHALESDVTTGAWRAPITNFLACAEQSFVDEVAHELGKDPIDFRLEVIERGVTDPVGEMAYYEPAKLKQVIEVAREKGNWGKAPGGVSQGFSAYYSHNTYVAEVAEVELEAGNPRVKRVHCTIDCGIVVNPLGAINQVQGGVVDGIGHALYGELTIEGGRSRQANFDDFRMIRITEAPEVTAHFIESTNDPTGLGEPTLPPAGGALANALFKATGERLYKQPFVRSMEVLG